MYYLIALAWNYIPEFYDNVYTFEEATPVPSLGDDRYNFELKRAISGCASISGSITIEFGKSPIDHAIVYAKLGDEIIGGGMTGNDGFYIVSNLPPDVYNVTATAVGYNTGEYANPVSVVSGSRSGVDIGLTSTQSVEESSTLSPFFLQVMPNPIAKDGAVFFMTLKNINVEISLHDVTGRRVKSLHNGEMKGRIHKLQFTTQDIPQGVYFLKISSGEVSSTKKVVVLR